MAYQRRNNEMASGVSVIMAAMASENGIGESLPAAEMKVINAQCINGV